MPKPANQTQSSSRAKVVNRIERDLVERLQNKIAHAQRGGQALSLADVAVAVHRVAERYAEFLPET